MCLLVFCARAYMCVRTRVSERGCGRYCGVAGVCVLELVAVCCSVLQCVGERVWLLLWCGGCLRVGTCCGVL